MARRNLTDFYRAELALRLKNSFAENAKANQRASGGAVPLKSAKPVDTRKELASVAGVSPDTISKVEAIKKHADEATKAKLRKGDKGVSINSIYKQIQGQSATSKQANVTPTLLSPSTNDITTSESEKPKLSIPAPVVFPQQVPSGEHTGQSVLKILEDYHAELSAMTAYIEGATMMVSSVAESDLIVQRCNKIREQALALAASCEASRLANTKNAHISTPPNSVAIPVVMTPPPIR